MSARTFVVAVGGTGQMVLHFYAQLFLLGVIPESFRSLVIDSDQVMPSLAKLAQFFDEVRQGWPGTQVAVPSIDYLHFSGPSQGKVRKSLTGESERRSFHPVETLFDSDSLEQQVTEGLFARPALSAVMAPNWASLPTDYTEFQRVIVLGSIIGGTGGGLLAPLLAQLSNSIHRQTANPPALRALFFGEFFKGDPEIGHQRLMPDAGKRFPSNKLMVATAVQRLSPPDLQFFTFIDPTERIQRKVHLERAAIQLEWPRQSEPYWTGVSSLERLRKEAVMVAQRDFLDREIQPDGDALDYEEAQTRRHVRTSLVNTMLQNDILARIADDPLTIDMIGRALPLFLASAYSEPRNRDLSLGGLRGFVRSVASKTKQVWAALSSVFPADVHAEQQVASVRRVVWGKIRSDLSKEATASSDMLAQVAASNFIYRALRGEAQ